MSEPDDVIDLEIGIWNPGFDIYLFFAICILLFAKVIWSTGFINIVLLNLSGWNYIQLLFSWNILFVFKIWYYNYPKTLSLIQRQKIQFVNFYFL